MRIRIYLSQNIDFKDLCEYDENSNLISSFVNFSDGKPISIKELSFLIAKLMDYKGELIFEQELSRNDGTLRKTMSRKKFDKLGFTNQISLENGLKKMIEMYGAWSR